MYAYNQEEIDDEVREMGKLPNMTLGDVNITTDSQRPQATLAFTADAKRYASRAGKRLFVPLNVVSPLQGVPDPVEERNYPLVLPLGKSKVTSISFVLPEGYRVESLPDSTAIDSPFGQYQLSVTQQDDTVLLERNYSAEAGDYPAEDYAAYREFLLAIAKADGAKMVLVAE